MLTIFSWQVIHGLSIPLGKVGYLAPRTISRVITDTQSEDWRTISRRSLPLIGSIIPSNKRDQDVESNREVRRARGERVSANNSRANSEVRANPATPPRARVLEPTLTDIPSSSSRFKDDTPALAARREIRFHDEVGLERQAAERGGSDAADDASTVV